MPDYKVRDGYVVNGDIAKVAKELESIRESNGGDLRPPDIVDAARPEGSVLHGEFEWDDAIAGELHRIDQARRVVRSITIVRDDDEGGSYQKYVSVRVVQEEDEEPEPRQVYRDIEDTMVDPVLRSQVLTRALSELAAYRKRYAALSELAKVFAATDEVLETGS